MCEATQWGLRRLGEILKLSRGQRDERVYPKGKVRDFFTVNRIEELGRCSCGKRGCCSHVTQAQPPKAFTKETISEIRKSFTSALALLVSFEKGFLIFEFINKGFNDERLATNPLTKEQLRELLDLSNPSGESTEEFRVLDFDSLQNEFFLPQISYGPKHQVISDAQSLPFSIKKKIGNGAYSTVYEAQMLHGYHNFPHVKDGRVAVKAYTDWNVSDGSEHSSRERENNERWNSHDYITPMQAYLGHREVLMTIWPLAKQDLWHFMKENPPKEYLDDPSRAWKRFANLLSALNHIHTSDKYCYGYHFDIKPHNILVRFDDDWAITDLGLAYSKTNESGVSETVWQGGNERYRAPEDRAHRNYDVWAMGCIGCEIIVWLSKGAAGVEQFRNDREQEVGRTTLDNFHHNKALKEAVVNFFQETERQGDLLTKKVAAILRKMLESDPCKRPDAHGAEKLFREVLGMPPPPPPPPPVIHNSLSPLEAKSRRASLNVIIPNNIRPRKNSLSPSSSLRSDGVSPSTLDRSYLNVTTFIQSRIGIVGAETLNIPQIQVTKSDDPKQPNPVASIPDLPQPMVEHENSQSSTRTLSHDELSSVLPQKRKRGSQ